MAIKQHPFWERPFMALHFRVASAHIGLFELPRTSVSGHSGQMGASLDVGATLAGSSCENIGLMSGICAFSLIVLVLVAIGKSAPLHFSRSSRGKKSSVTNDLFSISREKKESKPGRVVHLKMVVGGVPGWEGGNLLLLLQILVISATHAGTHSVQTSVSAWAFPIPMVQNHLQRRAPCVLARPQHLSVPRLCLRHRSGIIGSYSLLQGGQLGTKNNKVKVHAADVWIDGDDDDTLRIDVSFAEGIADNEALQSAVEGDALLMLKSVVTFARLYPCIFLLCPLPLPSVFLFPPHPFNLLHHSNLI